MKREKNKLNFKLWMIFIIPPFNGLFILVYSYLMIRALAKWYFNGFISAWADVLGGYVETDEELRNRVDFYISHFDVYLVAWVIGIASLMCFGYTSAFNVFLVKSIELVVFLIK